MLYYQDNFIELHNADCLTVLSGMEDNSIDLLVTDPPYGLNFMGKSWDKALPDKRVWTECLRVLKDGAFAFVMSIPRADCLSRMIGGLEEAGFNVGFSPIYHTFASGFPKAQNISKAVDRRLGAEREVIGKMLAPATPKKGTFNCSFDEAKAVITKPASPQAKALDGSYAGMQLKPAVEVVIVAMKPLSEKTYCDQALKNRKGITWLDDGRIPYDKDTREDTGRNPVRANTISQWTGGKSEFDSNPKGRFCANLLVSDDVLNDGEFRHSAGFARDGYGGYPNDYMGRGSNTGARFGDSGSFSRYFDLDKWWEERIKQLPASVQKTFPFLIVPKASKSEKNKGCEDLPDKLAKTQNATQRRCKTCGHWAISGSPCKCQNPDWEFPEPERYRVKNNHPTVKPLKLMSYLITLGSREGDIVLDPFLGSGTTALAAKLLGRRCIAMEISPEYCAIAARRCSQTVLNLNI